MDDIMLELQKKMAMIEARQERNYGMIADIDKTMDKLDNRLDLLEKHIHTDIESIKLTLASAKGTMSAVMFAAPFVFAGISFMMQTIIQKLGLLN